MSIIDFIKNRRRSIGHAMDGIKILFKSEINARIHFFAAGLVFFTAIILRCNSIEFSLLSVMICLVISLEIINTAIEKTLDFVSLEKRTEIKKIKDLAAAAVLIAAIFSVFVGALIFIPKLLAL